MKQFTLLKVLTFSTLFLASFPAFAMIPAFEMKRKRQEPVSTSRPPKRKKALCLYETFLATMFFKKFPINVEQNLVRLLQNKVKYSSLNPCDKEKALWFLVSGDKTPEE